MRPLRVGLGCALALGALALPPAPAQARSAAARLVDAINAARVEHGVRPLRASRELAGSSRRYARWMLAHQYFGHLARIRASRRFRWLGETLELHSGRRPQVGATLRAWLRSPGHARLLLSPTPRWIGAGWARGRLGGANVTVWVAHVGRL
ncbi:MAG: CAP domain-containing protein [Nocardioidaceae bacterium]